MSFSLTSRDDILPLGRTERRMPGVLRGQTFASLATWLQAGRTRDQVYQAVVESAPTLIAGCDHASIMLADRGSNRTVAASDDVAALVDSLERATGQGPCLDAIGGQDVQHDPDLGVNTTWPLLAERVLANTPVRGMLAFRLADHARETGSLNIFSDSAGALDETAVDQARVLAAFATVAITAATQHSRAENLATGLNSNREIGKAIGLIMATHSISDVEAFDVLKRASQALNRKLADIAGEFIAKSNPAA